MQAAVTVGDCGGVIAVFDSYEMEGEDVEEKLLNMPKIKYFFSTKNVVTRACKLSN